MGKSHLCESRFSFVIIFWVSLFKLKPLIRKILNSWEPATLSAKSNKHHKTREMWRLKLCKNFGMGKPSQLSMKENEFFFSRYIEQIKGNIHTKTCVKHRDLIYQYEFMCYIMRLSNELWWYALVFVCVY